MEDVSQTTGFIGQPLTITCTVTRVLGLVNEPVITWLDSQNNVVTTVEGIITVGEPVTVEEGADMCDAKIVTTVTLEFTPLITSHTNVYTCRAELQSSQVLVPRSATWDITVFGKRIANILTVNGLQFVLLCKVPCVCRQELISRRRSAQLHTPAQSKVI